MLKAAHFRGWWKAQLLMLAYVILTFAPPLMLNVMVRHLEGSYILPDEQKYALAALFFVLPVLSSITFTQHQQISSRIGLRCRNALTVAVYRKALRLSSGARAGVHREWIGTQARSDVGAAIYCSSAGVPHLQCASTPAHSLIQTSHAFK